MYYALISGSLCVNRVKAGEAYTPPEGLIAIQDNEHLIPIDSKYDDREKKWLRVDVSKDGQQIPYADRLAAILAKPDNALSSRDTKELAEIVSRLLK